MKKSIQIDVIGPIDGQPTFMKCKMYIGGYSVAIIMSDAAYRSLMNDGVFLRDGKTADSAGVINTTNVFYEGENGRA